MNAHSNFETIRLSIENSIAVVTLNRPDRLNAINGQMMSEMNEALDHVENDPSVNVLVLLGEGRSFCAGYDLKESSTKTRNGVADWAPELQEDFEFLIRPWRMKIPTIAAVQGHCIAAGMELACACDVTIAAEGTRFGEPELRFGAGIVSLILPWLVGPKKSKEWLLTGDDRIDAQEALQWGLINRVVPADNLVEQAMEMAKRIALVDAEAARMTKNAINRTFDIMGLESALSMGVDTCIQVQCSETPERRKFFEIADKEGLKAAVAWREARVNQS